MAGLTGGEVQSNVIVFNATASNLLGFRRGVRRHNESCPDVWYSDIYAAPNLVRDNCMRVLRAQRAQSRPCREDKAVSAKSPRSLNRATSLLMQSDQTSPRKGVRDLRRLWKYVFHIGHTKRASTPHRDQGPSTRTLETDPP